MSKLTSKIARKTQELYFEENKEKYEELGFETRAIHYGQPPDLFYGSVNTPIHLSSAFTKPDLDSKFAQEGSDCLENPTRLALESCIASLENGKYAIVAASGWACTMLITHLLKAGDHIISGSSLSGATENFFTKVVRPVYGMEVDFINMEDLEEFESAIKLNTKLVMIESVTNPILRIYNIMEISSICQKYGIILAVDNTLGSPFNIKPLDLGADIVLHSFTKYISGHSDLMMGGLIMKDQGIYEKLYSIFELTCPLPSPIDCYLVLRSIKTLGVRANKIAENSMKIAQFLNTHEMIEKVYFTGLPEHDGYDLYSCQATGHGGIVSFELKNASEKDIRDFLKSLSIIVIAGSLGGCRTTVECPALMSHRKISKEEREKSGIADSLIRLAVGIEDVTDLIADIKQALKHVYLNI